MSKTSHHVNIFVALTACTTDDPILQNFTSEDAKAMISEAEQHSDDGQHDVFDGQLNFDEYFKSITTCERMPDAFQKTRKYWIAISERLAIAETIGLLRQDIALGYQNDVDEQSASYESKLKWYLFHPSGHFTSFWSLISSCLLCYITVSRQPKINLVRMLPNQFLKFTLLRIKSYAGHCTGAHSV